jgi:hypothetical protein
LVRHAEIREIPSDSRWISSASEQKSDTRHDYPNGRVWLFADIPTRAIEDQFTLDSGRQDNNVRHSACYDRFATVNGHRSCRS